MATITVRGLSDETKERLVERAKRNGRSTEAEVRAILDAAANEEDEPQYGLGTELAALWEGVDTTGFEVTRPFEAPRYVDFS